MLIDPAICCLRLGPIESLTRAVTADYLFINFFPLRLPSSLGLRLKEESKKMKIYVFLDEENYTKQIVFHEPPARVLSIVEID